VREAERAAAADATPLTLYTRGRSLGLTDPEAGVAPLEQSLKLAERRGEYYFAAQVAGALSARLITLGRYRSAATWARWGLKLYHREGVVQDTVRLSLLTKQPPTKVGGFERATESRDTGHRPVSPLS
jgi:hypothetical protein